MKNTTEVLSRADIEHLVEKVRSANELLSITSKVAPVLLILTILCWMYDWDSILKFILTISTTAVLVSMVVIFFKNRQINNDLRDNRKAVETFTLQKKIIEGYVNEGGESGTRSTGQTKRFAKSIILADDVIRHAIMYKQQIKSSDKFQSMMLQSDIYEAVLSYTYKFRLKDEKGKLREMEVPIELYLNGIEGEEVTIAYAPHSETIFDVRGVEVRK